MDAETKILRRHRNLSRCASGDNLAVLVSDGDPIARATGEGAARNGDHRPQRMLTHRTDVLALRIEHPVPYARLGDNDLCTPSHEFPNTMFGKRRNLLPIRIIDMIPSAIIIDVGYLPLLCSSR